MRLFIVVALAPRDLSARGGHFLPSWGGRHGRRVVLIAVHAQGRSVGYDAARAHVRVLVAAVPAFSSRDGSGCLTFT
jgi:hypothetical protein